MDSHNYNTRNNSISTIEGKEESETSPCDTIAFIKSLETKLLARFDGIDQELLNIKDVVIKNLQVENQKLRNKINQLENKVISLEANTNSLEQYGRRNNLEISGIPDSISNNELEDKVIEILSKVDVNVSKNDIEACHRMGKSKKSSKRTIVRFVNRRYAKKALINRKKLITMDKSSLGLSNDVFINENVRPQNGKIYFHCRQLKRIRKIENTYTRDGIVHIASPDIEGGKHVKIFHMNSLYDLFPDHDFGKDAKEEDLNVSFQSSY